MRNKRALRALAGTPTKCSELDKRLRRMPHDPAEFPKGPAVGPRPRHAELDVLRERLQQRLDELTERKRLCGGRLRRES